MVMVGCYGGLRVGELAGLRRGRVDFSTGRVEVAEIAVEVKGHLIYGPPKTKAGQRSITLPRSVLAALKRHMAIYTESGPDAFVFTAPEGGPLRVPSWRQRYWNDATPRSGAGTPVSHTARHEAHCGRSVDCIGRERAGSVADAPDTHL